MISQEQRELIPLVSKGGCVDLRALRVACVKARYHNGDRLTLKSEFEKLFVYYYLKETDPEGDEPMRDVE